MRSTKCCIVLSASVNTSIPICTQPFAAHGLAAVLHLSKRKSPPLEEEKRQSQKKRPPHSPYLGGGLAGPDSIITNLRIDKLYGFARIERIIFGSSRESD